MTPEQIAEALAASAGGRYGTARFVGAGGMALVFTATDRRHGRPVAVKVIRPELVPTHARARFQREIATLATLNHPHIIPLFDSGLAGDLPFYVMPWIEGESLRERLARDGRLPLATVVRLADDIAAGLQHAHDHGVVHRDVKPANVLLVDGRALVSDFGIARAAISAGLESVSTTGIVIGTPTYMSPEQAAGERELGPASDQYALACVVFEMLTGRPPFAGGTPQRILAQHVMEAPPSVASFGAEVPAGVGAAVERALAKDAADRFPRVADFVEALREAAPPGSGSASAVTPPPERSRRRGAVLVALAVAAAVGGGIWSRRAPGPAAGPVQVLGLPLVAAGAGSAVGDEVAFYLGSLLTQLDGLRWLDGWHALSADERAEPSRLTDDRRLAVAKRLGASFVVDGRVLEGRDSVRVVLRMLQVNTGRTVQSATGVVAAAQPSAALAASVRALNGLLPRLVGRDGVENSAFEGLADRDPAAVALWLAGERAFRRARYDSALALLERAVARDSNFPLAMLRAAEAADAEEQYDRAAMLARLAAPRAAPLAPAYRTYASGLDQMLHGRNDSALVLLRASVQLDSTFTRAWFALGDLQMYRYPVTTSQLDAAWQAFNKVLTYDPSHVPTLQRAVMLALWRRDLAGTEQLLAQLERHQGLPAAGAFLRVALRCHRDGRGTVDWNAEAQRSSRTVVQAGAVLARAGFDLPCAESAFRAAMRFAGTDAASAWTARLGLHSILRLRGAVSEADALIREGRAMVPQMAMLYCLPTDASGTPGPRCSEAAAQIPDLLDFEPWMAGIAAWLRADRRTVDSAAALLRTRGATDQWPGQRTLADAMQARSLLLRGDTAAAVAMLRGLRSSGRATDLIWGVADGLQAERLLVKALSGIAPADAMKEDWPAAMTGLYLVRLAGTGS